MDVIKQVNPEKIYLCQTMQLEVKTEVQKMIDYIIHLSYIQAQKAIEEEENKEDVINIWDDKKMKGFCCNSPILDSECLEALDALVRVCVSWLSFLPLSLNVCCFSGC